MLNSLQLARLDLNLLVLFSAVYEERHVGRAARRLSLTPSAISHALGRLRDTLKDPLFLRTPRGVVPTMRANELARPIADILARVHAVVAVAQPFDPATSRRRFTIAAPDAVAEVLLMPLLAELKRSAPGVDISLLQVLKSSRGRTGKEAWQSALEDLEKGAFDVAVLPIGDLPARFEARRLYEEEFVVAMRRSHAYARRPTLRSFCTMRHLLVSRTGDTHGFVDELLARKRLSRHVAVTVPSFMMALSVLAETDLIAVLPRTLVERHTRRFDLVSAPLPVKRAPDPIRAVVTKAALADPGVAYVFETLARSATTLAPAARNRLYEPVSSSGRW
ncbi:MAG TPA: LysR family transcriptional regulator [Candidatus Binatia bacterium]|nr:LysR family transcriptional regulator [Candidatus Binatia bacterium]